MARRVEKQDFPVAKVRRYLEPGPIVLVSSAAGAERNVMTLGWHTVMEFTPSLVGCMIAGGNHSFGLIRRTIQGRTHRCRLERAPLTAAMQWLRHYERFWNERLDDLERALEQSEAPDEEEESHAG